MRKLAYLFLALTFAGLFAVSSSVAGGAGGVSFTDLTAAGRAEDWEPDGAPRMGPISVLHSVMNATRRNFMTFTNPSRNEGVRNDALRCKRRAATEAPGPTRQQVELQRVPSLALRARVPVPGAAQPPMPAVSGVNEGLRPVKPV